LKNREITITYQHFLNRYEIWMLTHFGFLKPGDGQNFDLKNPTWWMAAVLKKVKSSYLSDGSTDRQKFGMVFDPL